MANISVWTKKNLEKAKAILSKHDRTEYDLAIGEISKALGVLVTKTALSKAFESNRLKSPYSMLRLPALQVDPVLAHKKKEDLAEAKQEIGKLTELLREARQRQKFLDKLDRVTDPPEILARETKSASRELTAVVLASDWHVEETVEAEAIGGLNEYNLKVADRRITKFFQSIIWNIEHDRADGHLLIRDLVLWLGGDLITGFIHEELREMNGLSPTQAVIWLVPRLRDGILTLLEHLQLESLVIPCSHGNHGRTTFKSHISNGYANSFEWLMYHWLKSTFSGDPRVVFEVTGSAHQYVKVYDSLLHFHHGDQLAYKGGVGGLAIPLGKMVPKWDQINKAAVHNIGHFHQLMFLGPTVVNGSLIGYNPFAMSIGASPEIPQQAMYYVDKKRGFCLPRAIWVDGK
jgi:hypothetical protein